MAAKNSTSRGDSKVAPLNERLAALERDVLAITNKIEELKRDYRDDIERFRKDNINISGIITNKIEELGRTYRDDIERFRKDNTDTFDGLNITIRNLSETIHVKTAPLNHVTWKLIASIGLLVSVAAGLYATSVSTQITGLRENINVIGGKVDSINDRIRNMNNALSRTSVLINDDALSASLKGTTTGTSEELTRTLPRARTVLTLARENRISLPYPLIRREGLGLLRLDITDSALQAEVWVTISEFATYKSFLDARNSVVPPAPNDPVARNYYYSNIRDNPIELGSLQNGRLENAIFVNSRIKITDKALFLRHVGFFNCEFIIESSNIGKEFFRALLASDDGYINLGETPPQNELSAQPSDTPK